jgi:uncharacterized ferritin-like protein (DUF455 family)
VNVFEFASTILLNGDLEDKLTSSQNIDWSENLRPKPLRVSEPTRSQAIKFSSKQIKFPGKGALKHPRERGKALHFFANHELLAIEMMAQALLLFPNWGQSQQRLVVKTLEEEQKHFRLYLKRMQDFNISFGDFPLNSFFWSFMEKITTPEQFFAVISLTFEQANLDFARYYMEVFLDLEDHKTYEILKEVYEDEIRHVARGRTELLRVVEEPQELWDFYCANLPENLTPARAKGLLFDEKGRMKAGLNSHYIETLKDYKNSFSITNRKQWKS